MKPPKIKSKDPQKKGEKEVTQKKALAEYRTLDCSLYHTYLDVYKKLQSEKDENRMCLNSRRATLYWWYLKLIAQMNEQEDKDDISVIWHRKRRLLRRPINCWAQYQ